MAGLDFPSSPISILDCQSFLILNLLGGLAATYGLVTSAVELKSDALNVGDWPIARMVLRNLCVAGIAGIAPGFDSSIRSINLSTFPGMQVVLVFGIGLIAFYLVMTKVLGSLGSFPRRLSYSFPSLLLVLIALGVGSRAFYRLVMVLLLHLDLGLFLNKQISCFTTPGSSIVFTDYQFFLMLILLGGLVAAYRLAAADVATDRTVVSGGQCRRSWLLRLYVPLG
jgi:hypothetical protein